MSSNISLIIGQNIRDYRRVRALSMVQLAELMRELGCEVSLATIGAWQRGEREISAECVFHASQALGCTVGDLYKSRQADIDAALYANIASLNINEKLILDYCFSDWSGDTHALIQFCGLYMTLPNEVRAELIDASLNTVKEAVKRNERMVHVPYIVDKRFIVKKWSELF